MKLITIASHMATAALLMTSALTALAASVTAPATATISAADAPTASLWYRLWRTPDQRGQALLQQGDAAGAAQTFADPQRKAHAAMQAHDYAAAAKTLSGIDTAEAHYNRGSALAHAADLQGAIDAYDAALKHNPHHTDAHHNRDVVAAALKKQIDNNKDSNKQDKQNKKDKDGGKAGDKPDEKPDGKDGKPGAKPGDAKDAKPADKPNDKSEPKQGDAPGQKPTNKPDQSPSAKPGDQPASAHPPGRAPVPTAPASSPKDDAAQAQRDAESTLGKGAPPGATAAVKQPLTEKQIAQEQWLRAIPDDPGGLLRRKFLIEHMLRQQRQKQ